MAGRTLEAALHLLDRQLVDKDGRLAGKVDDLGAQQLTQAHRRLPAGGR